jgi:hypothetical protein
MSCGYPTLEKYAPRSPTATRPMGLGVQKGSMLSAAWVSNEIELSTVESTPAAKDTTKPDRRAHGRYIWKVLSTNEGHDSPPELGEVRAVFGANDNHSSVARVDQDSLRGPRGEYITACPFFYIVEYVSSCRSN